jgi:hypothetical protein
MSERSAPVLIKPLPPLVLKQGVSFGPVNLNEYIQSNPESGETRFFMRLEETGDDLPYNIICTREGFFGGIPGKEALGEHQCLIIAENDYDRLLLPVSVMVVERPAAEDPLALEEHKTRVWQALQDEGAIPSMEGAIDGAFTRPITPIEIYYLLQRFGSMTIWDVYNLESPGEKVLLTLPDSNKFYNIYDRGCCIVGAPKSLFSHERTLADAIDTAKVMAREVYKRNWTIEFGGFNKMVKAAWIELQVLGDKLGKRIEIMHYTPSPHDLNIYTAQAAASKRPTL